VILKYANPEDYFDQVIEINLSELEPHINGPLLRIEVLLFQNERGSCMWPTKKVEWGPLFCTNSS
jgi:aconitate hydratase